MARVASQRQAIAKSKRQQVLRGPSRSRGPSSRAGRQPAQALASPAATELADEFSTAPDSKGSAQAQPTETPFAMLEGRYERDDRVAAHLPLVRQVVQQLQGTLPASVEYDEVMSWGIDGLLDAFHKFDPTKATQFPTYARIRIRGAILDQLRSLDWVSRTARQKANSLVRSAQKLEHQLGRQVSQDELAEEMGLDISQLHDLIGTVGDLAMVSIEDVAVGRNNERLSFEEFVSSGSGDPVAALIDRERAGAVAEAIRQLPERERMVMPLYYHAELTMKEVGARLGITESRVSQLHTQAIARLKSILASYVNEPDPTH